MDKQNTGDAINRKGTVTMIVPQLLLLMKEEAELKKQLEATNLRGEELKAQEKNFDPKLVPMLTRNFEGIGLEQLEKYDDMLVEMKSMIADHLN